jgi:hypothetical protein
MCRAASPCLGPAQPPLGLLPSIWTIHGKLIVNDMHIFPSSPPSHGSVTLQLTAAAPTGNHTSLHITLTAPWCLSHHRITTFPPCPHVMPKLLLSNATSHHPSPDSYSASVSAPPTMLSKRSKRLPHPVPLQYRRHSLWREELSKSSGTHLLQSHGAHIRAVAAHRHRSLADSRRFDVVPTGHIRNTVLLDIKPRDLF